MIAPTLRIIDGPDRGKVFTNLSAPITIGREDGNSIELNDERVSRYHLKIFDKDGSAALADLGSTNGTLVNGEPVSLWILRPGDLILIGKTLLLYGSQEEISHRLRKINKADSNTQAGVMGRFTDEIDAIAEAMKGKGRKLGDNTSLLLLAQDFFYGLTAADLERLRTFLPPELPEKASPDTTLWLSDFFLYVILRLRAVIMGLVSEDAEMENIRSFLASPQSANKADKNADKNNNAHSEGSVVLQQRSWQNLLDLYSLISEYQYIIQRR